EHVHLAVADMAVAFAVEGDGVFVSRGQDEPFARCEPLAGAGPVEFEGSSSDAALFGTTHAAGFVSIIRVDQEGAAVRIADFGSDAGPRPDLTALSWDATRKTLWGASPQMGLISCAAPSAKGKKKVTLS